VTPNPSPMRKQIVITICSVFIGENGGRTSHHYQRRLRAASCGGIRFPAWQA
jgi:hypothetical protein